MDIEASATEKVLPQETLRKIGMTLDQIGAFIATYGVTAEVHHATDSSIDKFRTLARQYLNTLDHHVIVNYLRKAIGQELGVTSPLWRLMMPTQTDFLFWMCPDISILQCGCPQESCLPR